MDVRAIGAALLAACAACIVEGNSSTRGAWDRDDPPTTLRELRADDPDRDPAPDSTADADDAPPAPPPARPPKRPRAVTIPDAADLARRKAARADAELDAESESHDRPVISNLDASGEPLPGTAGSATPDALERAWPGAKPIPLTEDGSAEFDESAPPEPPAAGTERDPGSFVQPLRSYGRWIDTPDQGRVWLPYVDADWQPYTDGVWSDTEYGWAFTSYDPWGWAVWHYGAWGYRAGLGWYWQPGRVWAPAWVSWRWGGGYACWRPIAPSGAGRGPAYDRAWVAVPAARFTEPLYNGGLIRGEATRMALARSKPIPNPVARPVAGVPFGPPVAAVAQAVGHPVVAAPATQLVRESTIAARSAAANESRAAGGASFLAPSRSTWREPNPDAVPHRRPQINYGTSGNESREPAPGAAHPHASAIHPSAHGGATHASPASGGGAKK